MDRRQRNRAAGFTLAESLVSIIVVGVMVVAALNAAGAARLSEAKLADRSRGLYLAQDLLSEILPQDYVDRVAPTTTFGMPGVPMGTGTRFLFNDVNDYQAWSAAPQRTNGTIIPNLDGWIRSVKIELVDPTNLTQTTGADQGVKRITVTVTHRGVPVASLFAFRTSQGLF